MRLMLCLVLALQGKFRPSSVSVSVLQLSNPRQAKVKEFKRFKCNPGRIDKENRVKY